MHLTFILRMTITKVHVLPTTDIMNPAFAYILVFCTTYQYRVFIVINNIQVNVFRYLATLALRIINIPFMRSLPIQPAFWLL